MQVCHHLRNFSKKVFDAVSICLVTDDEDKRLSKKRHKRNGKGDYTLVSNMPEGYEDYIAFPFARYDQSLGGAGIGINISGWSIVNGKLVKQP